MNYVNRFILLLIVMVAGGNPSEGRMNHSWSLDFTAGGSITGPTFHVVIGMDGQVTFQEKDPGKAVVKEFRRALTDTQRSAIYAAMVEHDLIHLASQDFQKTGVGQDSGRYFILVQIEQQKNQIVAGITYKGNPPASDLDRRLRAVTETLNTQLGVDIF